MSHRKVLSYLLAIKCNAWLFLNEPAALGKALGVVTRAISSYLIKKSGLRQKTAKTGAITVRKTVADIPHNILEFTGEMIRGVQSLLKLL